MAIRPGEENKGEQTAQPRDSLITLVSEILWLIADAVKIRSRRFSLLGGDDLTGMVMKRRVLLAI